MYDRSSPEWTQYYVPKSRSHGHTARKRDPLVAWAQTKAFLDDHCVAAQIGEVDLTCHHAWLLTGRRAAKAARREAERRFGLPTETRRDSRVWRLPPSQIEEALDAIQVNAQWPNERVPPMMFCVAFAVGWPTLATVPLTPAHLRDDETARGEASHLTVQVLQNRLFLQPHFVFPLPWNAPALSTFLQQLEHSCPFRFRDQYFRRLVSSARRQYSQVRRLEKGWRQRFDAEQGPSP